MSESSFRKPPPAASLSAKLLILTVVFILISEALIYVPSISRFRRVSLEEHLAAGHLAALALEATPDALVDTHLRDRLLFHAGAKGVAVVRQGARFLTLSSDMPPMVDETIDIDREGWMYWIDGAFRAMVRDGPHMLRIVGASPKEMEVTVEVVLDEAPLRQRMVDYSKRILWLSLIISAITATFVYLGLQWMMIRPMRRLTASMMAFRADPEADDPDRPEPIARADEIGIAQRMLRSMQDDLRAALRQRARLAALGGAVAKINHDLRNSLATAVLVSDKLAASADPTVREVTPKLIQAIDRAVDLCSHTLAYADDRDIPLDITRFYLSDLLADVASGVVIAGEGRVESDADTDPSLEVDGDETQLHRALGNLGRNAVQAGAKRVGFTAREFPDRIEIRVSDDGPGLSQKARDNLFKPFAGSARKGGTGLGLVIVRDILRAHGGEVDLDHSGPDGTVFRLTLPKLPQATEI